MDSFVQLVDQQLCEHSRMNLSTTMSAVAEDMEDTVVDMWPQVSHKVHILIGVFIMVSGGTMFGTRFTQPVSVYNKTATHSRLQSIQRGDTI